MKSPNKANMTLNFYFDYVSNNAYLAWIEANKLGRQYNLTINPIPVLFAGLLKAHKQLGPAEIPAKRDWMRGNVQRKAKLLGIPLNKPYQHPFNPLLALRASLVDVPTEDRERLISAIFEAVWAKGLDVTDEAVIEAIFAECGLEGAFAQFPRQLDNTKIKLRENTQAAVKAGIFGVPTMIVDGELFWGYDDFPYLELFLQGNDPLTK